MRTSGKTNSPPGWPSLHGQAQGEEKRLVKRGAKPELRALSLHFGVSQPSSLEDVFSFACQIKLSCNISQSVASNFCCSETKLGQLKTPLTYMVPFLRFNLAETTSAWPPRAKAKHSRSATQQKLPRWKLNVKKTQHSGSDRSPVLWKAGQQTQTGQKLTQLSLRFQKTSRWGRNSSLLGWKDM